MPSRDIRPVKLANGETLECGACGHDEFASRSAQLNTPVATFFGVDWANQSATCHVCAVCGHLEWFLPPAGKPVPFTRRRPD